MLALLPLVPATGNVETAEASLFTLAGPAAWTDPSSTPMPHLARAVPEHLLALAGAVMPIPALRQLITQDLVEGLDRHDTRRAGEAEMLLHSLDEMDRLGIGYAAIDDRGNWLASRDWQDLPLAA